MLKMFNVSFFSDTINGMNAKQCMLLLLMDFYLFVLLSVTVTKVIVESDLLLSS